MVAITPVQLFVPLDESHVPGVHMQCTSDTIFIVLALYSVHLIGNKTEAMRL